MPKVLKFPLTLEDALRRWLPKVDHSDRMPIYKQYLQESLHYDFYENPNEVPRPATDQEIQEVLKRHARGWFTEDRFRRATEWFLKWHHFYKAEKRKARSVAANDERWEELRRKKSEEKAGAKRNKPKSP